MAKMNFLDSICWILSIIGGVQLGLQGAFNYDLAGSILGATSVVTRVLYVLIGVSAIYGLWCMVAHMKKHR